MDPEVLRIVSDWGRWLLGGIISGALGAWAVMAVRDRTRGEQIEALRLAVFAGTREMGDRLTRMEAHATGTPRTTECAHHAGRILAIEERLRTGPTHEDLGRVHERIDRTAEIVAEMKGTLGEIKKGVDLLTRHQLMHGRRAGDDDL